MMRPAALLCAVSLLEAVAGIALHDGNIKTAVAAWLSDSHSAARTYGHISTWETGGVTKMSHLFCAWSDQSDCNTAAASFNADIGAWDTSGVTTMFRMFSGASAFNKDIGGWAVDSVTDMREMFSIASSFNQDLGDWRVDKVTDMGWMFYDSAFNQDLGWCVGVGDDVDLDYAFLYSECESTSCGVVQVDVCWDGTRYVMNDSTIKTAVAAWLSNPTAAEATYGHISTWETGGVTDMSQLFCASSQCGYYNSAAETFNEDIGAWDTSGVTAMNGMFYKASAFNRDIGGWAVHSATSMNSMFRSASAFNQDIGDWAVDSVTAMYFMFNAASAFDQDLGWCVDDGVDLSYAFHGTLCESTSCGVVRCPTKENNKEQLPVAAIAGAAAAALLLAVGAFWFYRRRKASTMDNKADEPSGAKSEPTELSAPEEATTSTEATGPESLQTRAAAKAKAAETVELSSFSKKLTSFLFREQEEAPEAEEEGLTEQPPPPPRRWFSRAEPEPAAPKAEEIYNQIAAWYNAPENAALRATWGADPGPDEFQTWPGFVVVTNAYLDREAG